MDENRAEGTARKVAGKAQESIGRLTGDAKNASRRIGQRNPWIGPKTCMGRFKRMALRPAMRAPLTGRRRCLSKPADPAHHPTPVRHLLKVL
jgi:hypothetical protein